MLACAAILEQLGKNYLLYIPQGLPHYLNFMTVPAPVCNDLKQLPFAPRWAVFLDCSEISRLGTELANYMMNPRQGGHWHTINIDHHICKQGLGTAANFITTAAAATCQLMAYTALALNMPLRGSLAEAIGTGILTDTGHFCHGNTTAEVFDLASLLERGGVRLHKLAEKLHDTMSINRLRLFGTLFSQVHLACNGRLAYGIVYQDDLRQMGCSHEDLEGFVDWIRNINGVEIAMLMRELENGRCKFSLRSRGDTNVQTIAAKLGGGGHKNAAGGMLECAPQEGIEKILEAAEMCFQEAASGA